MSMDLWMGGGDGSDIGAYAQLNLVLLNKGNAIIYLAKFSFA